MSKDKVDNRHAQRIADARKAALSAHAPYSGFQVGCVVETADGQQFVASNMENASYGVSMCAEVGALMAASHAIGLGQVRRIVVSGGYANAARNSIEGKAIVTPCGRCRQLILEASQLGGGDIDVVCASGDGEQVLVLPISQLLPHGFGPANLAAEPAKVEESGKQ